MPSFYSIALALILIATLNLPAFAESALRSIGVREASAIDNNDPVRTHTLALRFNKSRFLKQISSIDSLEIDVGRVKKDGRSAAFLSLGPVFRFTLNKAEQGRWFLEAGGHLSYFGDSLFQGDSDGGNFQFKSHLGLGRTLGKDDQFSFVLDYRHISNAGLQDTSLGADLVSLSLIYQFNGDQ
jgi:hypothetical protein